MRKDLTPANADDADDAGDAGERQYIRVALLAAFAFGCMQATAYVVAALIVSWQARFAEEDLLQFTVAVCIMNGLAALLGVLAVEQQHYGFGKRMWAVAVSVD